MIFRKLSKEETAQFKDWADNNTDKATLDKVGVYHPVIILRWLETGVLEDTDYLALRMKNQLANVVLDDILGKE